MSLRSPSMRRVEVVASGQHLGRDPRFNWKEFSAVSFFHSCPRSKRQKIFRIRCISQTFNRHNDCSKVMSLLNPSGEEQEL